MRIRVGLSADNLIDRLHTQVTGIVAGKAFSARAVNGKLVASGLDCSPGATSVLVASGKETIKLTSLHREGAGTSANPSYRGKLEIAAVGDKLRLVLLTDLESYIRGVLN